MRIIYDRNRPISKGMAYVEFQDKSSIPALELTGETLRGQKVMVKHSEAEKTSLGKPSRRQKASQGKGNEEMAMERNRSGPCALFVAGLLKV